MIQTAFFLQAALNMAMRVIAYTVKDQGILVVNICPGWVKTDMGSELAHLEVEESISSMLKTFPLLNESNHAALLDRNGKTVPF
ncbi:c-factor [Trichonephila clavata]|uniref:C-factor n=1 Tax=Trichonephila clavata TaxID=2740835 RepID=A0A8X6FLM8_TRICU|nr:c-factor [Trichonephila clavata]